MAKNIRNFCGKPIIAYSIECALESSLFDRVIVSTDDEEIASVAIKYGAEVPFFRPTELSDDHTGTNAVVRHAIQWYLSNNESISVACCIYATAPLLQVRFLKEGYEKLTTTDKSFVFSIVNFPFELVSTIATLVLAALSSVSNVPYASETSQP